MKQNFKYHRSCRTKCSNRLVSLWL